MIFRRRWILSSSESPHAPMESIGDDAGSESLSSGIVRVWSVGVIR